MALLAVFAEKILAVRLQIAIMKAQSMVVTTLAVCVEIMTALLKTVITQAQSAETVRLAACADLATAVSLQTAII